MSGQLVHVLHKGGHCSIAAQGVIGFVHILDVLPAVHRYRLLLLVIVMSLLLVAELPMFSLKFKDLSWGHNKVSYIFLIVSIPLLVVFRLSGFAAVIVWYILLSLITRKK